MNLHSGDLVTLLDWSGLVKDVYRGERGDSLLIWFYLVKNVYKGQRGDILPMTPVEIERNVSPATPEIIKAEIERTHQDALDKFNSLIDNPRSTPATTGELQVGEWVSYRGSAGLIQAVFRSPDTDLVAFKIFTVRDWFTWREDGAEVLSPRQIGQLVRRVSPEEVYTEIERKYHEALQKFQAVLPKG